MQVISLLRLDKSGQSEKLDRDIAKSGDGQQAVQVCGYVREYWGARGT